MKIGSAVLALLLALGAWHEISVLASRDNPPLSCQFLGGQWNIFTGWQCGVTTSNDHAQQQDAQPADPSSLPPGVTAGTSPGTYYVDCFTAQCTMTAGAGPFGTTCSRPGAGEQFCQ